MAARRAAPAVRATAQSAQSAQSAGQPLAAAGSRPTDWLLLSNNCETLQGITTTQTMDGAAAPGVAQAGEADVRDLPRGDAARGSPVLRQRDDDRVDDAVLPRMSKDELRARRRRRARARGVGRGSRWKTTRSWRTTGPADVAFACRSRGCSSPAAARPRRRLGRDLRRVLAWQPDRAALRVPGLRRRPAHPAPDVALPDGRARGVRDTPWACHVRCGTHTRWRVISEDVARVPHGDAPAVGRRHRPRKFESGRGGSAAAEGRAAARAVEPAVELRHLTRWRPRRRRGVVCKR